MTSLKCGHSSDYYRSFRKEAFKNSLLTEKKDYTINSQIILPKYNEMLSDAAETVT